MRTPLELARALGWPEARQAAPVGVNLLDPTPTKLIVWRQSPGAWLWVIGRRVSRHSIEEAGPMGRAPTQPAALALGLAALDTHSVRATR